jgi:hypothetical protein
MKKSRGAGLVYRPAYLDKGTGERKVASTWWIQYSVRGRRFRESSGSRNRTEAEKLLQERLEAAAQRQACRARIDPPAYAQVNAKVVQQGRDAIPLGFRLRQEGNDWKIYDVTVDEISITANYRNQFSRVIEQRGLGQLMSDLRAKQQELDASLGKGQAQLSRDGKTVKQTQ